MRYIHRSLLRTPSDYVGLVMVRGFSDFGFELKLESKGRGFESRGWWFLFLKNVFLQFMKDFPCKWFF